MSRKYASNSKIHGEIKINRVAKIILKRNTIHRRLVLSNIRLITTIKTKLVEMTDKSME